MIEPHNLYVTTGLKEKPAYVALAHEYCAEIGGTYIQRRKLGLEKLQDRYGANGLLVVSDQVKLYLEGREFFFHPSMANTRIKRLRSGENDLVIEHAGVGPGDTVLDCTLGLGSDSIVFAHAVGDAGRVIGLEASPVIAALVRRGLQEFTVDVPEVNRAMRRVEVFYADHLDYLRAQPDRSVDVIYFDPMFRRTVQESNAIEPLRVLGDDSPLSVEAIREARRVARRRIVLKERWYSKEFDRLGFVKPRRSSGSTNYGIIEIGGTDA
ncbi:class I SAM-dependent methyltransferase [Tumebacillus sp. DT12]|uniref:Class I SAM-dependent methyltransferase n=1 Tax=Tumebacillus lacus TaxID=2995335 RepID=A0ABT3WW07_9BACL|nr:class I SAM-dependent methyltransferase [Tumebacillus lacus]MCX7568859.1 class I SAM-dependent methyltransferase [Tumebacillus lacus]